MALFLRRNIFPKYFCLLNRTQPYVSATNKQNLSVLPACEVKRHVHVARPGVCSQTPLPHHINKLARVAPKMHNNCEPTRFVSTSVSSHNLITKSLSVTEDTEKIIKKTSNNPFKSRKFLDLQDKLLNCVLSFKTANPSSQVHEHGNSNKKRQATLTKPISIEPDPQIEAASKTTFPVVKEREVSELLKATQITPNPTPTGSNTGCCGLCGCFSAPCCTSWGTCCGCACHNCGHCCRCYGGEPSVANSGPCRCGAFPCACGIPQTLNWGNTQAQNPGSCPCGCGNPGSCPCGCGNPGSCPCGCGNSGSCPCGCSAAWNPFTCPPPPVDPSKVQYGPAAFGVQLPQINMCVRVK